MIPITDSIKSFRRPWVMYTLLVVNIAIFIWQYFIYPSPIELIREYGFIPREFFQKGDFASLITYMFLHGNIGHITGNMLYLYIFGDNVEDVLGHFGFLIAYIFWGVVAAIVQGLTNPTSTIPVIGASGAISGVLGAYMVFFPSSRIITLVFIPPFFVEAIMIPAWFYIGFW
ncbi:MAG: rhomboid family intramembrane serine protease, partial [Thermotogae bacterium]|nr:rhomboid family intramembrane serine protease [Thermotogota bacterium]